MRLLRTTHWLMPALLALSFALSLLTLAAWSLQASAARSGAFTLALDVVATGFSQPVAIAHAGDDRLFIVERAGKIWVLHPNGNRSLFLDISARVNSCFPEQGLLGLAFHPNYAGNDLFYVNYVGGANCSSGETRISRFAVTADPDVADPNSEATILTITQPATNHNAGDLKFGPDGYLYVPTGDGGSQNDPQNHGQRLDSLLGKVLRLDVDSAFPYAIPADNPFIGVAGARAEIWAYGLRNPWRISFDRQTGDLFIGDVGQNTWEEINWQPANSIGGENYGWRCYEGNEPHLTGGCPAPNTLTMPIHVYAHANQNCSVTGGFLYRGSQFPDMVGRYFLADFCSNQFTSLQRNGGGWTATAHGALASNPSTFGEGADGELYVASYAGTIYHLIDANNTPTATPSPSPTATATPSDFSYLPAIRMDGTPTP